MKHNPNICAAEAAARARSKVATELLLASLQRHHPDQGPQAVPVSRIIDEVDDVVSELVAAMTEPARDLPPVREKVSDWAQRQHDNNPLAGLPDDPDAVPIGIPIRAIQNVCAQHYGITLLEMVSIRRTKEVMMPRQVAMYLAKKLTLRSFPEIGRRFGGRDHTTVLHAVRKIERLMRTDPKLVAEVEALRASLA